MHAKLTKRTVAALKPPAEGVLDCWDTEIPAFHVRVWPSGKRSYRLKYRAAGRQRIITIGSHGAWSAEKARDQALDHWNLVSKGGDPLAEKKARALAAENERRRALTVRELIEKWLEDGRAAAPAKREISWATDASRLRRHVVPLLGSLPAGSLTRADIEDAQRRIARGETAIIEKTKARGRAIVKGGKMAARSAVVSLSSAYSWAVDRELVASNPCLRVKKEKPFKRERFLSEKEAARLLDTLSAMQSGREISDTFADAIRVLLLTGARKAEILGLRWSEVDLDRGVITLPRERSKTGEKILPLNAPAAAVIAGRPNDGDFVFPSKRDPDKPSVGLQKIWEKVRERAELHDVRIHDLRHTFASFAAASGASLPLIAIALGHTQIATTQRYAHLGADPVRDLAERVGRTITKAGARKRKAKPRKLGRARK